MVTDEEEGVGGINGLVGVGPTCLTGGGVIGFKTEDATGGVKTGFGIVIGA